MNGASAAFFRSLQEAPPDKILSLVGLYAEDPRPSKIDLGIGVYRDEKGRTPILRSVRIAEEKVLRAETTKTYVGPAGDAEFVAAVANVLFGEPLTADRIDGIQTPGGAGALSVLANLLSYSKPGANIWLPMPTWTNHVPIFEGAGMALKAYPYFDPGSGRVDFGRMLDTLGDAAAGDIVLLHGCCHNPTGADLRPTEWSELCDVIVARGLLPFVDLAYQGFGDGLDTDAFGVRLLASKVPEMVVAYSCSKNFGIYRERTGAAFLLAETKQKTVAALSHLVQQARISYSMPPDHGSSIVRTILNDPELTGIWKSELDEMRSSIARTRSQLAQALVGLTGNDCYNCLSLQKGMFSLIGVTVVQAHALRSRFGIYVVEDGRINVAGLRSHQAIPFVEAVAAIVKENI